MGNEESHYPKIEIDDEAVEVTDGWSLHYARDIDSNVNVHSAFVSQPKNGQENKTTLERLAKNLMIYRHPCIVRYISSWTKNSTLYLITEEVKPLALIVSSQSPLQICIGLQRILTAVVFLHEKAKASHNNICCASVYVTSEGIWKLGGLEYLRKFSDVTPTFLQESRAHRYNRAIPPEENSLLPNGKVNAQAIDKYAFGILVEELLKKKSNDEIPFLAEFRDYCKKKLWSSNMNERVSLSEVLSHQFFHHDFIKISRFLFDLPLKTSEEKEKFFRELPEQLSSLPEDVVGSQLASLLLSRVVLLDATAQKHLLPVLLQPKRVGEEVGGALFTEKAFKRFVVPKLLQIFCVRDSQIRLILLTHFHSFCDSFTREEMKERVLPELLLGIKDVDDELVSMTLKGLSRLVTMLGAATVVGGKRSKIFTDGRPKEGAGGVMGEGKGEKMRSSPSKTPDLVFGGGLPERPSPDGGEDTTTPPALLEGEGDAENWSDWDGAVEKESEERVAEKEKEKEGKGKGVRRLPDIAALDIKSRAGEEEEEEEGKKSEEVDFFRDMEPVISRTHILRINSSKTKFDVESDEVGSNWGGWGEDWELEEVP